MLRYPWNALYTIYVVLPKKIKFLRRNFREGLEALLWIPDIRAGARDDLILEKHTNFHTHDHVVWCPYGTEIIFCRTFQCGFSAADRNKFRIQEELVLESIPEIDGTNSLSYISNTNNQKDRVLWGRFVCFQKGSSFHSAPLPCCGNR